MALQHLLYEAKRRSFVAGPGDLALEDLGYVTDRPPELYHLAVELHVHLIEMPTPMAETSHPIDPRPADVTGEKRVEPLPPHARRLATDIYAALEQQVFQIAQR